MLKLQMPIPSYKRIYNINVALSDDKTMVIFEGKDANGVSCKVSGISNMPLKFGAQSRDDPLLPFKVPILKKHVLDFTVLCRFQAHFDIYEPILSLKVPMSQLKIAMSLNFAIVFNLDLNKFEKVLMRHGKTNQLLGQA